MKCKHCKKRVYIDMEQDLIHAHLENKPCDARFCKPKNKNSKIAEVLNNEML